MNNRIVLGFVSFIVILVIFGTAIALRHYEPILSTWLGSSKAFWSAYLWIVALAVYFGSIIIAALWIGYRNRNFISIGARDSQTIS